MHIYVKENKTQRRVLSSITSDKTLHINVLQCLQYFGKYIQHSYVLYV